MAAAVQRVPIPLRRGNNPISRAVCRYWKSGNCSRKPCRFLHADPPPPPVGATKKRTNTWLNPSSQPIPTTTTTSAAVPPVPPTRHAQPDEQAPPPPKRGCRAQEEEPARAAGTWCVGDGIRGVARLAGHARAVTGVAVPEGSGRLFSGSLDGTVRAWDCGTGQCVGVALIQEGEVRRLTAMSPWVLAGARGAVIALHTGSGEEHRLPLPAAGTRITALLDDDEHLFAGAEDGAIYIWSLDRERQRFEEVAALAGHDGHAAVASLARGKGALYSGLADGVIMAWDLATRRRVCGFAGHASRVTALLCWDQFLLSASDDGTVKVWRSKHDHKDGVDPELEVHYTHREEEGGYPRVVAMDGTHDADGKPVLLVARGDGVVRLYDLPSFKARGEIRCDGEVTAISVRTPGMVFTGDESGEVRVAKWTPAAEAQA
ncbi:unnamed protein product [Alopecurus aequalis]